MSAMRRPRLPLRWSMNEALHAWFLDVAHRLDLTASVLIRMFALQLKEGEPGACDGVPHFVRLGLHEALVTPKTVKVFLDEDLYDWLTTFATGLRHPASIKRKVHLRHLLTGYILFVREHEQACVKYGSITVKHALSSSQTRASPSPAAPWADAQVML